MTGVHSGGDNPGKYYCELKEFTEGELAGESAETNSACTDVRGDGTADNPFRSYELCGAFAAEQAALEAEISAAKTCEPLANCNSHHCMQDGFLGDGLRLAVGEECSFVGNFVEVNMEVHWTPTAEELAGTATTNAQ